MISENKIKYFKEKLESHKTEILKELESIARVNPDNPQDWEAIPGDVNKRSSDPNKRADNMEDYENNTAILKQLEKELLDINDALKKIEDGTYGLCEISGQEIELKRLEANPAARTCVAHINEKK